MATPGFAFVPRKLAKSGEKPVKPARQVASSSKIAESTHAKAGEMYAGGGDDSESVRARRQTGRLKQKEAYLDDGAYAALLELALSDHALWSSREMLEIMETNEDGFVPLSYVTSSAPAFAGMTPIPPELALMRCIKSSSVLEGRMVIAEPCQDAWIGQRGGSSAGQGGFEVRRKDWTKVRERIRKYTSFQWDSKTIYVENLPHSVRTVPAVYQFVRELLADGTDPGTSQTESVQIITFPFHRDDKPGTPPPTKSRGFAFVVLLHVKDAEHLLQRWPWSLDSHPSQALVDTPGVVAEAVELGFRCLSKKEWDRLKMEYLSLQRQLLEKTMTSSRPGPSVRVLDAQEQALRQNYTEAKETPVPAPAPAHQTTLPYPADCLVFVKNVHPETNKTTLRSLFTHALGGVASGAADAIDYVDYNKGLDSCLLRLTAPQHARALVAHFSDRKITQASALDSEGAPPAGDTSIEIVLVQGKKEEVYWEKVPEKIRKQAVAKAQGVFEDAAVRNGDQGAGGADAGGKKRKRRKHG
ncbi:hypothetical protein DFH11DRAFT_1639925 [Phellopilus nigrolimitatus]|nr:hypothetical protein DFH11DRAFT_1639925 [Phellopilus nigrolimitatus]